MLSPVNKSVPKTIDKHPGRRLNYLYGGNGLTYNERVKERDKKWKSKKRKAETENNDQSLHAKCMKATTMCKELSLVDKMRHRCLQYGGDKLDSYDWSLCKSEMEKQQSKHNYEKWSRRCEKKHVQNCTIEY